MHEEHRQKLLRAAEFFKTHSRYDMFPTSWTFRGQEINCLISIFNTENHDHFGLSREEFKFIFHSRPTGISERIKEHLNHESEAKK